MCTNWLLLGILTCENFFFWTLKKMMLLIILVANVFKLQKSHVFLVLTNCLASDEFLSKEDYPYSSLKKSSTIPPNLKTKKNFSYEIYLARWARTCLYGLLRKNYFLHPSLQIACPCTLYQCETISWYILVKECFCQMGKPKVIFLLLWTFLWL